MRYQDLEDYQFDKSKLIEFKDFPEKLKNTSSLILDAISNNGYLDTIILDRKKYFCPRQVSALCEADLVALLMYKGFDALSKESLKYEENIKNYDDKSRV